MKDISQPILGDGSYSQWGLTSSFTLPPNHSRKSEIIWTEFRCYQTLFLPFPMRGETLFKGLNG